MSTEITVEEAAQGLFEIFKSNDTAYGCSKLLDSVNAKGKRECKHWYCHEAITERVWQDHLTQKQTIGCIPILKNNMCHWGALDIDIYDDPKTLPKIIEQIREHNIPMVPIRSKSGGAHVFLFTSEPIPAANMIEKLKLFGAFFGQAGSEVFPKQPTIGPRKDNSRFGNWLNMPYAGDALVQHAIGPDGNGIPLGEFIPMVLTSYRLTAEQFKDLVPPPLGEGDDSEFPEGPPCLNKIMRAGVKGTGQRNTLLFNIGTYLRKAKPDTWSEELPLINKQFEIPLKDKDVVNIIRSHEKKEYERYQCSVEPLCRFCSAKECVKKEYGISTADDFIDPANTSLVKLKTSPPTWILTTHDRTVELTTDEFWNFDMFAKRVMEECNVRLFPMKPNDWNDVVRRLLQNVTEIEVPYNATPEGMLQELVSEFAKRATPDESDLVHGPVRDKDSNLLFRMTQLKTFLRREGFNALTDAKVNTVLKQLLHGDSTRVTISKDDGQKTEQIRCWRIPKERLLQLEKTIQQGPEEDPF